MFNMENDLFRETENLRVGVCTVYSKTIFVSLRMLEKMLIITFLLIPFDFALFSPGNFFVVADFPLS
jgi:hypothetical protein